MLSYCVKHKYIKEHPFKDLKKLDEPEMFKPFLEVEEAFKLLDVAQKTDQNTYIFVSVALYAGLRQKEILNLKWKDIDWKRQHLTVQCDNDVRTKSNKYRIVSMEEDLVNILSEHRKFNLFASEYLISSKGAKRVCIKKAYRNVLQRADLGKPASARVLRTTSCSFWAMTGVPLKQAQLWMGHSDVKITAEIYSQIVPSLQKEYLNSISKLRSKECGTNLAQLDENNKLCHGIKS